MILYLEYGSAGTNLNLINSEFSCSEFDPGLFSDPLSMTAEATAKINIHGRPALVAATAIIGKMQTQVATSIGRDIQPYVYLWYSPDGDQNLYRARVYRLSFAPEGSASYFMPGQRFITAVMGILHGPWEGELTQIPLTNAHATDDTAGIQVDNTYDATRDCTVTINPEDIVGDIPAPIRLEMELDYNTGSRASQLFWISHNVNSDPANFPWVLEAESAVGGTPGAAATDSNGNRNVIAVTAVETDVLTWTMTAAQMAYAAGNLFHALLRFSSSSDTTTYYRLRIDDATSTYTFWEGEQVKFSTQYAILQRDLGIIRLPPWRMAEGSNNDMLALTMAVQSSDGTSYNVALDCLYLMPVDSFRFIQLSGTVRYQHRMVDDQIESDLFVDTVAAPGRPRECSGVAVGTPILLHPGKTQKLYFQSHTATSNIAPIDMDHLVKIYYRPLRIAL